MRNYDLHNHSTRSDGLLSPTALIELATRTGTEALALTDHDTVDGVEEAAAAASRLGLEFIPGVEISVSWGETTVHVVGLQVDPSSAVLRAGLESLGKLGFAGTFEAALALAKDERVLSRTHFARHLAERGAVRDTQQAFDKYLAKGKPAFIPHRWAALEDAVTWIRGSGGVAVLAHPGRYDLKRRGDRGRHRQPPSPGIRTMATRSARAWIPGFARRRLPRSRREPVRARHPAAAARVAHACLEQVGALKRSNERREHRGRTPDS